MGTIDNIFQSCGCKIICCNKYTSDQTVIKNDNENDKENNYDIFEEDSELGIVKKSSKNCFTFASDIQNMKIQSNLIVQLKTSPWSIYSEIQDLGSGSYGVVKKVYLKSNPETIRAIKIIPKKLLIEGVDSSKLLDEILILKNIDHPNIMKLYEFFEDNENCYMVSEFCDQGDLLQKLDKLNYMNEIVVKFLMEQILSALAYLHSKGVIHGDIKLENVMLYTTTKETPKQSFTIINKTLDKSQSLQKEIEESFTNENEKLKTQPSNKSIQMINNMLNYEIKLIDFGCSKIFTKRGERKSGIIGTSSYCSPEVIDNLYDERCDEWSCGVLMYLLLCGEFPFEGETEEEVFKKVKKCEFDFSPPHFRRISKNCKDLIKKLLEPKIQKRIKAIDALKHPFFTESFNPDAALKKKDNSIIEKLFNLTVPKSQFHRAILSYMSSNYLSKDEEKKLRTVFRYIDYNDKSYLTKGKIKKALKEFGKDFTEEDIENIVKALDANKNGAIEYHEFIQGVCDKISLFNDFNLKNIFNIIDHGNKGYITSEDIKNFVFPNKTFKEEAISAYLNQFGMKIHDKIFFDDFKDIIQNNCSLEEKKSMYKNSIDIQINKDEQIFCFDDSIQYTEKNNSSDLSE